MLAEPITEVRGELLVGQSPVMERLRGQVDAVAGWDVNVLVEGESGTGKELVSRRIHRLSPRREGPFVPVNCAAIHASLLESELFGHEAGAFTGAEHPTCGFFRAADKGTLLLDEVGEMSAPLQSKLLRTLEDRTVMPVGGSRPVPIDVRVVAAAGRCLAQAVEDGAFRGDLYYRLNVVRLALPPLRERKEDIPALADHLLERVGDMLGVRAKRLSREALAVLMRYDWPGNVRELVNAIQRAYVLGRGPVVRPADLPEELRRCGKSEPPQDFRTLDELVGDQVKNALRRTGGRRERAARLLGVNRTTLWRMMARYSISC